MPTAAPPLCARHSLKGPRLCFPSSVLRWTVSEKTRAMYHDCLQGAETTRCWISSQSSVARAHLKILTHSMQTCIELYSGTVQWISFCFFPTCAGTVISVFFLFTILTTWKWFIEPVKITASLAKATESFGSQHLHFIWFLNGFFFPQLLINLLFHPCHIIVVEC